MVRAIAASPAVWSGVALALLTAVGTWLFLRWHFAGPDRGQKGPAVSEEHAVSEEQIDVGYSAFGPARTESGRTEAAPSVSRDSRSNQAPAASVQSPPKTDPLSTGARPSARPSAVKPTLPAQKALGLPKLPGEDFEGGFLELCGLEAARPESVELELTSLETLDGVSKYLIRRSAAVEEETADWIVLSRVKILGVVQELPIGTFRVASQALSFEWKLPAPAGSEPAGLRFCQLTVASGTRKSVFSLHQPVHTREGELNLTARNQVMPLPLGTERLPAGAALHVDLEVHGEGVQSSVITLTSDSSGPESISITSAGRLVKSNNCDVELVFRLIPATKEKGWSVGYRAFVFPEVLKETPAGRDGIPGWERRRERSDRFDRSLSDGIVIPDLARVEKSVNPLLKTNQAAIAAQERKIVQLKQQIAGLNAQLSSLLSERNRYGSSTSNNLAQRAYLDAQISKLTEEAAHREKIRLHHAEGVKFCGEFNDWVEQMAAELPELEKTLAIRYSAYLHTGAGRIVLAGTWRAPEIPPVDSRQPPEKSRRKPASD